MEELHLDWMKCQNDVWCSFKNLNLDHEHFTELKGVYIIWSNNIVVRLGSGLIKNRINDHRENIEICKYPDLKVTWAKVNGNQMGGVEKYLSDFYKPAIGERFPERTPIKVNLPW